MIAIGSNYLVIVSSFYIIFSTMFVTNGVLRGAGDTLIPMFFTVCSLWLIHVPSLRLPRAADGHQRDLVGNLSPGQVGALLSVSYYRSGRWKRKVVVKIHPAS